MGRNSLRDALLGPDGGNGDLGPFRTGVIVSVSKTATPWTVTVRLAEGAVSPSIPCLGWYDPVVNDVVLLARVGPSLVVLGGFAGAAKVVATTTTLQTPGAPAAPPPPPPSTPTTKTVTITADASHSHQPPYGWRSDDHLYQGGSSGQRGLWFYGSKIATAKGSGTITAGTIYVQRRNTSAGVSGAANVRLGTHSYASQPGGAPAALGNVAKVGALNRGDALRFALTAAQIAALNAGATGLGLEPGALGYSSADYFIGTGRAENSASGQLSLTITP